MICLVRLIGVERQTRMKGAGSRTHMMVSLGAALMTLVSSYGFLPIVGAAGVSATALMLIAQVLLRGVERRDKMQVTELAVGLTDGKATLCVCTTGWSRGKSPCERSISSGRKAVR